MKVSFKLKALAAVLALAGTSSAFATSLDSTGGSIVLNVYDGSNGDSYVFDTGLNASTLSGGYSVNLSSDSNFAAFLSATSADASQLQYDVVGVQKTGNAGETAYSTATSFGTAIPGNTKVNSALTTGVGYYSGVNLWSGASSAVSAFVNTSADAASFGPFESSWSGNLQINDLQLVGSAVNFYTFAVTSAGVRSSNPSTLASDGSWSLIGSTLTYVPPSTVPVPASWGLLLSGLALMGIVARRGKSSDGVMFPGAAA